MAQEVVLKVVATTKEAEENLQRLNDTINEQNEILVDLERELYKVEEAQKKTSKSNLAAQKKLTDQANHLKSAIKDQRLSLRELNAERRTTKSALDSLTESEVNQSKVIQGIDKVTGGYATKIKKLYLGLVEGVKGLKLFIGGLSGLKKALIATGVGALVVALGTVIAYWDDIKGLINGVSSEQKKLLKDTEATRDANKKQLEITESQENSLKLQGKSEKEIRDLKIQQTNEVIASTQALLLQQKEQKKAQVEAAQRNADILKGILMFISAPLTIILATIDKISAFIGEGTNLVDDFYGGIANMVFDPKAVEEEGDKTIEATENSLRELQNKRDGYILKGQEEEKKAADKRLAEQKKRDDEQRAYEEKVAADRLARLQKQLGQELNLRIQGEEKVGALRRSYFLKNLGDDKEAALIRSQFERERVLQEIDESEANDAQKRMAKIEVNKFFDNEELRIEKDFQDKKTEEVRKAEELRAQIQQAKMDMAFNATSGILGALSDLNSIYDKDNEKAAKRSFERNKKLQIGLTIISTLQSAQQAYASQFLPIPTPDSPVRGAIAAGVALFAGYARVRAIEAQRYQAPQQSQPQTGGGGNTITAPQAAPQFNIIGGGAQNQLAGLLADQTQKPVKAYVVSNEVTTAQSLDRNIVESATLG